MVIQNDTTPIIYIALHGRWFVSDERFSSTSIILGKTILSPSNICTPGNSNGTRSLINDRRYNTPINATPKAFEKYLVFFKK